MIDRVLVTASSTDGEDANGAIEVAAELARAYDAELVLVNQASAPDLHQVLDPEPAVPDAEVEVTGIAERFPTVRTRVRRARSGDPVKTVMNLAMEEKADVVVMLNLLGSPPVPTEGDAPGIEPAAHRGPFRSFYADAIGWAAVFMTSFLMAYGGGAVLFWLHAVYRGERGPAISDWSHWLLDSTLGFVALTPVLFLILPIGLWIVARGDGFRRLKLWSYVAVVGTMFTLVTGPGPLVHNAIAGQGTWLANLAMKVFGENAATAERNMHAMEHSNLTEALLQIAVGLPVYLLLAWLALRLVKGMMARRKDDAMTEETIDD